MREQTFTVDMAKELWESKSRISKLEKEVSDLRQAVEILTEPERIAKVVFPILYKALVDMSSIESSGNPISSIR